MNVSPEPADRLRSTSRALPIALLRARETVMAPIRDMLQGIGLTEQKWRILRTLDELGEVGQTTIAREACILLPSLTRTLRAMEEDGLIHRRQDSRDKRKTLVCISGKGRQLLIDNMSHALEIYKGIEQQVGARRLEQLFEILGELKDVKI